jgi:hypothetical protein
MLTKKSIASEVITTILNGIIQLLENKHLYQSVLLNFSKTEKKISELKPKDKDAFYPGPKARFHQNCLSLVKVIKDIEKCRWCFDTFTRPFKPVVNSAPNDGYTYFKLTLPTVNIVCKNCKGNRLPHNSGYIGQKDNFFDVTPSDSFDDNPTLNEIVEDPSVLNSKPYIIQTFFFPYQCQKCKGEPIIFMVRRIDHKLQLVGRNHIEDIEIPKYLPKEDSRYYREAIIAYNAGKVLAGLFYLRTFIEQYMRRITGKSDIKITGEDLGDAYAKILNDEFPKSFTSLKKVYEELSIPLHSAKDNSDQFEKSKDDILKHFDTLRLVPLKKS